MTMENVANTDAVLAHQLGSLISGGVFTIVSAPSLKVKALGKGVYTDPLQFTFAGGNASGFIAGTVATTAPVDMPASATKCKALDAAAAMALVMREGDSVVMGCTGEIDPPPTPPASPTGPVAGGVEILTAGQTKDKAQ